MWMEVHFEMHLLEFDGETIFWLSLGGFFIVREFGHSALGR